MGNDVNTVGPSINTASTDFDTGSLNINTISPTLSTTSHVTTHADFLGDKPERDMSNINTAYHIPSTLNTRIHKDHSLDLVIGDVQSGVLIRKMTKTTHEQGFISTVYEEKTHEDINTCLFSYFLSQIEPTRVAKALTDPAWVEAMQEELLQFKLQKILILIDFPKEGIDYDKVFAHVARIEAIRLFLAYASFMGFMVYQMDVNSAFLYGRIEEEVYVCQPSGFEDPNHPDNVYKVVKALYDYQHSSGYKDALVKDADGDDVDVHLYRSMIRLLMYLTASRPDIIDSPFELVAYTDSDYVGASLDRKSTTGGCQFLGRRLISWQCKKQTVVATSTTEAKYVAAASYCGQGSILQGEGSTVPVESHHIPSGAPTTSQPPLSSPSKIPTRQETEVPQPSSPTHTHVADEAVSTGVDVRHGGVVTTGIMQQNELMDLVTKLTDRVLALENLKQTKKVYSTTFSKLILKVKKSEKIVKSTKAGRRAKIVVSDDEDVAEDTSKHRRKIDAIDQDPDISLMIVRVHEEASSFNVAEWEDIQATIKADEELALKIQAEKREKYSEAEKARLKRLSFDELKNLFEATMKRVKTFTLMKNDVDRTIPKIADESSKRAAEEELEQKSSKRQNTGEISKPREKEDDELTQEELQQMIMIVPAEEVYVKALQRFSTAEPTDDKKKELWVELKSLFKPDNDDTLWEIQRYMHDPLTWRLYDTCGVLHVSIEKRMDIFMLIEKEYPLSKGRMIVIFGSTLPEEMLIVYEKRRNLADELRSIRGIVVMEKVVEFVTDTLRKNDTQVTQLREVERQMEFRALKKELFVQKLMGNTNARCMPLFQELARAADSNYIRDQLLVLLRRKVNEDSERMHEYRRLSDELMEGLRVRDAYIEELQMF
nr:hypothetical protein [Tanacetum cinerariifolium]